MYTDKEKQVYDLIGAIGWMVIFALAILFEGMMGK